jgi:hypothetical protein
MHSSSENVGGFYFSESQEITSLVCKRRMPRTGMAANLTLPIFKRPIHDYLSVSF